MKLLVGLGNPGREYQGTRHNIGFSVLDKFSEIVSADFDREGFQGLYGIVKNPSFSETIVICKPQTFMNLSGQCVRQIADYFKIGKEDIIVVYDDMALPEGSIRLRENGSSGGHKGMQSVIDSFSTAQIRRIRIGIGEPIHGGVDWVLGKPSKEDELKLQFATDEAAKALRDVILSGFEYAMNAYNKGAMPNKPS